ncbi:MAG: CHASE domain-containing protein, partial [Actinomycetota bacterium]
MAHGTTTSKVILGLAFTLTVSAWWFSHQATQQSEAERFEFRSQEIETAIVERMEGYETVLWSGVGLFDATGEVDRDQFAEYVATLDLNERWPGIQGIGWAVPLEPEQLDSHQATVRAEGFPDYEVSPPGDRDAYSAIVYLEPFDWRNQRAFGFDMWSNPARREAMARAMYTGRAATSSMITLVQETDEDVQRGFLTYVPVYEGAEPPATIQQREDALVGWVYAPFRMNDLMAGVLGSTSNEVDYQIFDGATENPESLLFDSSPGHAASDDSLSRRTVVMVQGHPWTMVFRTGASFSTSSGNVATYVAIAGLLVEALLFFVISSLGSLSRRAESIAQERTAELRLANEALHERSVELEGQTAQLTRSNDELRQFAHVASHDLQEPLRAMASYASLVTDTYGEELGDEGRRWLGYIGGSAKRLSDLIREILQFSTSDILNPDPIGVDLNQIMVVVQEDLAELLAEGSSEVVVEELPTVAGDPVQLQRLLTNLVHNAATYRKPDTALHVTVTATTQGDRVRIGVRDNGIG